LRPRHEIGRRDRVDTAGQLQRQRRCKAVADKSRCACAGQHDAQRRICEQRREEFVQLRAFGPDELCDLQPHVWLLCDLACRRGCAAAGELGSRESREVAR